jgi:hypothetical protein
MDLQKIKRLASGAPPENGEDYAEVIVELTKEILWLLNEDGQQVVSYAVVEKESDGPARLPD